MHALATSGVITDSIVVEPATSGSGVDRYMAPVLPNPSQFGPADRNSSMESDVYSHAMTAYEVRSSHTVHSRH